MTLAERLRAHEKQLAEWFAKRADFGDPKPDLCRDLLEAAEALERNSLDGD